MTVKRLLINLAFAALLGILPAYLYFRVPSMGRNAVLFGFSLSRFMIGAAFIFLLLLLAAAVVVLCSRKLWRITLMDTLDRYLGEDDHLLVISCAIAGIVLSGFLLFWWVGLDTTIDLNNFEVVFGRLRWMLMWGVLVSAHLLTWLAVNYRQRYRQQGFFNKHIAIRTTLLIIFADLSIFHWIILAFEIQIFASIPYWTWFFQLKEANLLYVFILLIFTLAVIAYVFGRSEKHWFKIFLLILLGYILQIGYGFVEGGGFESIKKKTTSAGHVWYLEHAVDNLEMQNVISNYEETFGSDLYLGTKPPGVLVFYLVNQRISFLLNPVHGYQARFELLLNFITYLFPLLTFLSVILIAVLSRKFFDSDIKFLPAVLFLFLPNIVLMPNELDEVLFPMLFLLGLYFTFKTIETYSWKWAFLTGLVLYLAVYFTFALLPLILLSVIWVGLDYVTRLKQVRFRETAKIIFFVGLGFLLLLVFAYLLIDYNMLLRYENAMIKHRTLKEFEPGFRQILEAIKLNNLEIAAWIGFPIAILCIIRVIRAIKAMVQRTPQPLDILTISFSIVYLILNFLGQTRGEVGRLWLFMTPLFVIFAGSEMAYYFRQPKRATVYLVLLQFITIFMTFRFQDFW